MSDEGIALLGDEAPISELEEFKPLIAEGHERGFLTFDQIASCLEETEVTKEQVQELHSYLDESGIDVVEADGKIAKSEGGTVERAAADASTSQREQPATKKVEVDLTVEPSLDSLRLYLRSIGRVDLLTAAQEVVAGAPDRARRHDGQAADDRGEPAARRLDREGLPRPGIDVP